jgi:hypothetical protein
MTYSEWIVINVTDPVGTCKETTLAMQKAFPELDRVRGHYHCWIWGIREHWWLVHPEGIIIDPTAAQFPSDGDGDYVPWDEDSEEPSGICLNCGEYVYDGSALCSENCQIEFMADLMG